MSFLTFILLLLLVVVGWPLLRGWLFMRDIRKKVNDTFGGNRQQSERQGRYDDDEEYTANGERKKYTSGEGEYADFEEVSGTIIEETTSDDNTRVIVEEQVIDAEFEEIH